MNDIFTMSKLSLGYRYDDPESAQVRFHSLDNWYINSVWFPAVFDFDARYHYVDMATRTNSMTRPTEVIVDYSPRFVGDNQVLFELDEPLYIGAAISDTEPTIKTFYLKAAQPIYDYIFPVNDETYVVMTGVGLNMGDFVDVSFEFTAQQIIVTMVNRHEYLSAALRYFILYGNPVYGGVSGKEKRNISSSNFKRSMSVNSSFYLQTRAHATWLANFLEDRIAYQEPVVQITQAPPLFFLEIGDEITYKTINAENPVRAFSLESQRRGQLELSCSRSILSSVITYTNQTTILSWATRLTSMRLHSIETS